MPLVSTMETLIGQGCSEPSPAFGARRRVHATLALDPFAPMEFPRLGQLLTESCFICDFGWRRFCKAPMVDQLLVGWSQVAKHRYVYTAFSAKDQIVNPSVLFCPRGHSCAVPLTSWLCQSSPNCCSRRTSKQRGHLLLGRLRQQPMTGY